MRQSLWENSQSFFQESVTKALLAETTPLEWKFAILAMVQAVELAVKERLRREHPLLVFADVDIQRRTVTLEQGIARLKRLETLDILPADTNTLMRAKNWRNAITHADFAVAPGQCKAAFATLLGFYTSFAKEHLSEEVFLELTGKMREEALSIARYAAELERRATSEVQRAGIASQWVWLCRGCGLEAFIVHDGVNRCLVCGWKQATVECEHCREIVYWDETEELDFGNYKSIELLRRLCRACEARVSDDAADRARHAAWYEEEESAASMREYGDG